MKPVVVLLHGLARTSRSMVPLKRDIEALGYRTWLRTYPSRRMSVAELAEKTAVRIERDLGDVPVVGITHSLGGILARHIGDRLRWKRLLMLAPPNRGSRVARTLRFHPLYRWFYGPAGQDVAEPDTWPTPPCPFSVIAGNAGVTLTNPPSWAIRSLKLLPDGAIHDGTVSVEETQLPGMVDFAEVPASHTFIMNHPQTRAFVHQFLETGRFDEHSARSV